MQPALRLLRSMPMWEAELDNLIRIVSVLLLDFHGRHLYTIIKTNFFDCVDHYPTLRICRW
jgi:hypothetical protein